MHVLRCPGDRIVAADQRRDERGKTLIGAGVRLALGQHALDDRGRGAEGRQAQRLVEQEGGGLRQALAGEVSQMLAQPRAPYSPQAIARFVEARRAPAAAALDQASMAAMLTGQQREHDIPLAMPAGGQHEAFVAPFHVSRRSRGPWRGTAPDRSANFPGT